MLYGEGLLNGYHIVVKDNINVRGFKTSAGTKALTEYEPAEDAPVVQMLKDAGAVVIGKFRIKHLCPALYSLELKSLLK